MLPKLVIKTVFCLLTAIQRLGTSFVFESKRIIFDEDGIWEDITKDNDSSTIFPLSISSFEELTNSYSEEQLSQQEIGHNENNWRPVKREIDEFDDNGMRVYNVGVLMASHLDSPFDLERCGPAVDLALKQINEEFLRPHNITLKKVQAR